MTTLAPKAAPKTLSLFPPAKNLTNLLNCNIIFFNKDRTLNEITMGQKV